MCALACLAGPWACASEAIAAADSSLSLQLAQTRAEQLKAELQKNLTAISLDEANFRHEYLQNIDDIRRDLRACANSACTDQFRKQLASAETQAQRVHSKFNQTRHQLTEAERHSLEALFPEVLAYYFRHTLMEKQNSGQISKLKVSTTRIRSEQDLIAQCGSECRLNSDGGNFKAAITNGLLFSTSYQAQGQQISMRIVVGTNFNFYHLSTDELYQLMASQDSDLLFATIPLEDIDRLFLESESSPDLNGSLDANQTSIWFAKVGAVVVAKNVDYQTNGSHLATRNP